MMHFRRLFSFATAVSLGVMASSSSLNAQAVVPSGVRDTVTMVITVDSSRIDANVDAGPRIGRASFTPAVASTALGQGSSGSQGLNAGSNVALMGVGAAGILVGSLVGGDGGTMISIGGGVLFFVGLFRWLR